MSETHLMHKNQKVENTASHVTIYAHVNPVSITYDSGVAYGKKYGICPGANNLEILIVSASFRLTDLIGWHKTS